MIACTALADQSAQPVRGEPPVKEQAGTELNLKLNTHATNLEHQSQNQRHLLGYPHGLTMECHV